MPGASELFSEQEALESAAGKWWVFLLGGIAWLIYSLVLFQWDYTTLYAVSILFGIVAIVAGVSEFMAMGVSTTGWKIVRAILGVIFIIAGIVAFTRPGNTFVALASIIGFWFLFKGIVDLVAAFATKGVFSLWWVQLIVGIIEIGLAFWVSQGDFADKAALLVIYIGIMALSKGITDIVLAFKLRGVKKELAAA